MTVKSTRGRKRIQLLNYLFDKNDMHFSGEAG